MCSRSSSVSSSGSSPVVAAAWLISASRLSGDRPPGGGQAARLVHLPGRVVRLGDQAVFLGVLVQAAQRGDEVLGGAAPAAGVAAGHHVGPDVLDVSWRISDGVGSSDAAARPTGRPPGSSTSRTPAGSRR